MVGGGGRNVEMKKPQPGMAGAWFEVNHDQ